MPSEFEYALTQLNRLEAGYRRLRRRTLWLTVLVVGQGVLLLYLLLPVGRLGIPKYQEANWFVLVDDHGRVRGEWKMDQGPKLELFTEKGEERAVLFVNHDNTAFMMLFDNHPGSGYAASMYAYDGGAAIDLDDPNGARAGFTLNDKKPGLQKIDEPPPAKPNP
jgi:hypothetical protein